MGNLLGLWQTLCFPMVYKYSESYIIRFSISRRPVICVCETLVRGRLSPEGPSIQCKLEKHASRYHIGVKDACLLMHTLPCIAATKYHSHLGEWFTVTICLGLRNGSIPYRNAANYVNTQITIPHVWWEITPVVPSQPKLVILVKSRAWFQKNQGKVTFLCHHKPHQNMSDLTSLSFLSLY